jgi:site-specific DNA-adenine methylase
MSDYGLPYMGSKAGIAASLALNFPKADHFYDLFGGGGSISHYMALNKAKNYKTFHYNEIKSHIADVLKRAIAGEFNYSRFTPKWISRDEFHAKKDTDGYIASCWSFGNNGKTYLFGPEIEPYKRSMHNAVVFGEFDELAEKVLRFNKWPSIAKTIKQRRFYLRQLLEHYRKTKIPDSLIQFLTDKQRNSLAAHRPLMELKQLEQLQQLERLQQLQQLQRLQQLERLSITSLDYLAVEILTNSVVYCDIPYQGTSEYGNAFSHKEFFDWAATRPFPVFISEYEITDSRFELVYTVAKRCILTTEGASNKVRQERLYRNRPATA